jgi:hypothetical protein
MNTDPSGPEYREEQRECDGCGLSVPVSELFPIRAQSKSAKGAMRRQRPPFTWVPCGINHCRPMCRCGGHLIKIHRSAIQKLFYSELYRCSVCGQTSAILPRWLLANFYVVFSLHSRCVRCGGHDVYRLDKHDRIDSLSKHPLSVLQGLLLAPLLKCPHCRLQFHDFRKPLPASG